MALHPLDLQIILGQMDHVGKDYLRIYSNPRKDQIHHGTLLEQRTHDIDNKVLDLPDEISDYQQSYLDPHESENERKKGLKQKRKKRSDEFSDKEVDLIKEANKGHFIDTRQ